MSDTVRPASELRSVAARVVFGTFFIAPGLWTGAIGLRLVEVDPSTVHAPYWLITMLGGMFVLAGLVLVAQGTWLAPTLTKVVGPLILIAILTALHWVAFGAGVRQCSGGWSIPFLSREGPVGDLECRIAFGYGAVLFDGLFASVGLGALAKRFKGGARSTAEFLSKALLLLAIAPLIPLLAIAVAGKAGAGWIRSRLG